MVYYGDEVGMWGGNDPDCRKPMVWDDIAYADEVYNVDGSKRTPDRVEVNKDLQAHYKKLIEIRRSNPALQLGSIKTLIADDAKDVYVFEREYMGRRLIVALNNSSKAQTVSVAGVSGRQMKDLLNGQSYSSAKGRLTLSISPKWGAIVRVR